MSPTATLRMQRRMHRAEDKVKDFFTDLKERAYVHLLFGTTTNVEFFMCGILILLGVWLMLPVDTFSSAGGYHAMRVLGRSVLDFFHVSSEIRAEVLWGAFLVMIGGVWVYGLGKNSTKIRRFAAACGVFFWTFIAACFILSTPQFWSSVAYPYYSGICVWLYLRAPR